MAHFSEIMTEDLLKRMIDAGYINCRDHPEYPLRIYNYATKASINRIWNPATLNSRGLILHQETGEVVARPFPKFFNLGEMSRGDITFSKPYLAMAKMDGSLGICYNYQGSPYIATRGSFESDQAQWGTMILRKKYPEFHPSNFYTFLFEIIHPSNRIVVDYGEMMDLVLLAVIYTPDGSELDIYNEAGAKKLRDVFHWTGPIVETFPSVTTTGDRIKPREYLGHFGKGDGSEEGFVFRFDWPKGKYTRVKIKHEEYIRLHRIRTNISSKTLWEALRDGRDLSEILDDLDERTLEWANEMITSLRNDFTFMKSSIYEAYEAAEAEMAEKWSALDPANPTYRQVYAGIVRQTRWPNELFSLKDGKNINPGIWRSIQPAYSLPFEDDEVSVTN